MTGLNPSDFWDPKFTITHRDDGSIVMEQTELLGDYLPTLADYLDKWADETPDANWIARRDGAGDWQYITYGQARAQARQIAGSLLSLDLGADRPLLILSENSLEHAVLGVACLYAGIPYAPVSPAYSLVSTDHGKLKGIAQLLKPGAIFADDGAAFAPALDAIAEAGVSVINARNHLKGALDFFDLPEGDDTDVLRARAALGPDTVVKYLFTSGSTGAPKAVINSNGMICAMEEMVRDCYRFIERQPPVVLDWAPWNHTAAGVQ